GARADLRRVVVPLARQERRRVVDRLAPGVDATQPQAGRRPPLGPQLQRVIHGAGFRLDVEDVAEAGDRAARVDGAGPGRRLIEVALADEMPPRRPDPARREIESDRAPLDPEA